jgi:hypothetical protein
VHHRCHSLKGNDQQQQRDENVVSGSVHGAKCSKRSIWADPA